jgi:hypothetical protein
MQLWVFSLSTICSGGFRFELQTICVNRLSSNKVGFLPSPPFVHPAFSEHPKIHVSVRFGSLTTMMTVCDTSEIERATSALIDVGGIGSRCRKDGDDINDPSGYDTSTIMFRMVLTENSIKTKMSDRDSS